VQTDKSAALQGLAVDLAMPSDVASSFDRHFVSHAFRIFTLVIVAGALRRLGTDPGVSK